MPFELSTKYLKITYHCGGKKINAYLKMPSSTFMVLHREVEMCLFEERKLPRCELRTYWIDEDGDEIEIFNQCDYDIFMSKRSERQHLQVAPMQGEDGVKSTSAPPPKDDPAAFVIHDRIECDACGIGPIVGFRYKCIECPNYDLCQRCEAAHKHSEHMMLRMPHDNCPTAVEAWVTGGGRCGRGRGKRGKAGDSCPFMSGSPQTGGGEPEDKEGHPHHHHHHGRKHRHQRHSMRNGIFHHLYDMMHDLAEGGANVATAEEGRSDPKASESAGKTVADAQNTANEAARRAQEAAKFTQLAFDNGAFDLPLPQQPTTNGAMPAKEQPQQQKNITVEGAAPKTPPSTPDAATATDSAAKAKQSATKENEQPQRSIPHAVPVMSPTLENLAQLVDPEYMKAGIQIMNNFSEMFAKMLDPGTPYIIDAAASTNQQPSPQQRKTSTDASSITSSVADTSAQYNVVEQPIIKQMPANVEQPRSAETNSVSPLESQAPPLSNTSNVSTNPFDQIVSPERRRSQCDDDWQLIDTQHAGTPSESFASVTTSTSTESIDGAAPGATATQVAATLQPAEATASLNYLQLSKDLRAHVLEEQLQIEQLQAQQQQQQQQIQTQQQQQQVQTQQQQQQQQVQTQQQQQSLPTISTTSNASTSTTPTEVTTPQIGTEETRAPIIYHNDAVINSAVHAMMAMGFSNEGAYLTQLLDSVSGNIAEALDIMSAAQRANR